MLIVKKILVILVVVAFVLCLLFFIVWCFAAVSQLGKPKKEICRVKQDENGHFYVEWLDEEK